MKKVYMIIQNSARRELFLETTLLGFLVGRMLLAVLAEL